MERLCEELYWEMLIWYNLCAWEKESVASSGEENNSRKPEDWSAPCWKRDVKGYRCKKRDLSEVWRGDGGRRSKRSQNKDVIGFFLGYEQNIFLGSLEDLPLLFWRMWDPYWWNKSNVLPPVISQFWFIVAGVMVILLSIKREKLPAIVIANPHILQLQLIFFSFFFAPIASSAIEIILFAASRVRMRNNIDFAFRLAQSGIRERGNCNHVWLMTSWAWTTLVLLIIICFSTQEPGEIWVACLLSGARWVLLISIRGKCLTIS